MAKEPLWMLRSNFGEENMSAKIIIEQEQKLEKLVLEAWYSGERFAIKSKNGFLAAIVPMEDLAVLEEIDSYNSNSVHGTGA